MIKIEQIYLKRVFDDAIYTYNQYFKDKTYCVVLNDSVSLNLKVDIDMFLNGLGFVDGLLKNKALSYVQIPTNQTFKLSKNITNHCLAFQGIKNIFNQKSISLVFKDDADRFDNLAIITTNKDDKDNFSLVIFDIIENDLVLIDIDFKNRFGGKGLSTNKYKYILNNMGNYQKYIIKETNIKQKSII